MSLPPSNRDTKIFYFDKQLGEPKSYIPRADSSYSFLLTLTIKSTYFLQTVSSNSYFLLMLSN